MTRSVRILLTILVSAALGACSNAGSVTTFPSGAHGAAGNRTAKSELVLRVRVPKRKKTRRGGHYISFATRGLTMSFVRPHTFEQAINLTPADPLHRLAARLHERDRYLRGSYTAAAAAYDEAPVDGAIPTGAKLLSSAVDINVTVKSGISNQLAFTLDGVPAIITVASPAPADTE